MPTPPLPRTPLMPQLHPHPTTLKPLLHGQLEHVVGRAVVEGALALQIRQGEDGAQAVVVVGAGGEGRAFGDAGVLVGEWWCEWMGEG